ncbi:hypothetical protein GCM10010156_20360 [Planobispora rosea]|uniref:Lasso peptide biosynthesis PqqD family chaperone n=1 Tax=Planobispora rosea TaxID=35762 RepID=A0A8J3WE23_PLARO|nr:lasso peptide biosynthesis PqqD family chaperone [Planobispora rosea]GGS61635.1 hypothetical protein GCM10010156_20360 [Planobispora rosea]GIH86539.1 hypothetical protein Pro02_49470 [Planobispora rosea]
MSLRLRTDVAATDTDYGAVLLDQRSGEFWQLNPTAALIIRRLTAGDSPASAAAAVAEEFEVGPDQALADVRELVDELRAAGLVAP